MQVHVKWEQSGTAHCYRWGVDENDGLGAQYDLATCSTSHDASSTPLMYTPSEVKSSLVEDIGELTKRGVLQYMKQISSPSWQTQHKLHWSDNTLVRKLSGEQVVALYEIFFAKFSRPKTDCPGTASIFASFQHAKILPVVMTLLVEDLQDSSRSCCRELCISLLLTLQSLSFGLVDVSDPKPPKVLDIHRMCIRPSPIFKPTSCTYEWRLAATNWGPVLVESSSVSPGAVVAEANRGCGQFAVRYYQIIRLFSSFDSN